MATRVVKFGVLLAAVFVLRCGSETSPTQPTCSIAIAPSNLSFNEDGGSGSVTVTAPASCTWNTASSGSWIGITTGASGAGPGTVTYSVAANGATESRSGTVTIAGQAHAVAQQGRAPTTCSYSLAPARADFGKDEATASFSVTSPGGCAWTASSSSPWLTISAGTQGTGSGAITYLVARNRDVLERTATITVADQIFTVRQAGDTPAVECAYSVAPVTASSCMAGGSLTATLTTQATCSWTVSTNASWLVLPGGGSGTGSGVISVTFGDNYGPPREGVVMVRWPTPTAGQNIHVAQAGCRYGVSRDAFNIAAAGGTGTFDVLQQSDPTVCGGATQDRCVWTAVSDVPWVTITSSMPRTGDNPVAFAVASNDGAAARVARITVRDKVVIITQAGR